MRDRQRQLAIAKKLEPVAEDPLLEAGFLLDHITAHPEKEATDLITRRLSGEPLQYVLGEWDYWGMTFKVDERALIPRPDTELLTSTALKLISGGERVLDLCCGSGCIGISIAASVSVELVSADISRDALSLTEENAERHAVHLTTVESDLFDRISGTFDLIVCNPPYLSEEEVASMEHSLWFEPIIALYGGKDGLEFYRKIREKYSDYLRPGGTMLLEIGWLQEKAARDLFRGAEILHDFGNRPRCLIVKKDDRKTEKTERTI